MQGIFERSIAYGLSKIKRTRIRRVLHRDGWAKCKVQEGGFQTAVQIETKKIRPTFVYDPQNPTH